MLRSLFPVFISIFIFGLIVLFHEFGHFIAARKSGIIVREFAIGMGPKLFYYQSKETLFSLRLLPIGGFCQMGEDDEEVTEGSFNAAPLWGRILTIAMGAIFNFILAFLCIFIITSMDDSRLNVIRKIVPNSPLSNTIAKEYDEIIELNGKKIHNHTDLSRVLKMFEGGETDMIVKRNGEKIITHITPVLDKENKRYVIGAEMLIKKGFLTHIVEGQQKISILEAIQYSFDQTITSISMVFDGLKQLISFKVTKKDMAGPLGIIHVINETYEDSMSAQNENPIQTTVVNLLMLTALISANLGVINLLPFPGLDGGRLFFLLLEGIRKKPISREVEAYIHFAGFIALMGLMVFVVYVDISNLWG